MGCTFASGVATVTGTFCKVVLFPTGVGATMASASGDCPFSTRHGVSRSPATHCWVGSWGWHTLGDCATVAGMTNQERDALLVAMKSLPNDQRQALVMRDVMNLDYPEIAEVLEIDGDSVRSLVTQARVVVADAVPTE